MRLGAGFEGAASAIGFLFLSEPVYALVILAVPAYGTYWLLRRGHRVATGILLLVLGIPGAAWWGFYLVQDAVDPFVSYDAVLWLWWLPEVALILAGALLIARFDREVPAPLLIVNAVVERMARLCSRRKSRVQAVAGRSRNAGPQFVAKDPTMGGPHAGAPGDPLGAC